MMLDPLELLARATAVDADADRRLAVIAALAADADRLGVEELAAAIADPIPEIRLLAQIGLALAGDRDVEALEQRLVIEPDLGVYAVLAARAARLPVSTEALTSLGAQAAYLGTPGELRAGCCWSVTAHDHDRGGWLAGALLADLEGAFWLASITARRGGPLASLVGGLRARPDLDRVAELIALPEP